jgi:hypothetical protein
MRMHNTRPTSPDEWSRSIKLAFVDLIEFANRGLTPRGSQNFNINYALRNECEMRDSLNSAGLPEEEVEYATKQGGCIFNTELYSNESGPLSRTVFTVTDRVHASVFQWRNAHDEFAAGIFKDSAGNSIDKNVVDADSEYESCYVIHKKLLGYRQKGFAVSKAFILVDGWKNIYHLKSKDEEVQVEFDLRKTLPRIGIKLVLGSPNTQENDIGALMFVIPAFATLASYKADEFMCEFVDALDRPTKGKFYKKFPMEDKRSWLEKLITSCGCE